MTKFTIDNIKDDIAKIEKEILSSTHGLSQLPLKKYQKEILRDILYEGFYQGHANWGAFHDSWQDYLKDVVNTEEGEKGGDNLKVEYETFSKASFFNSFAIVLTEYCYSILNQLQKDKNPGWQNESNNLWQAFYNVRNNIVHNSAKSIYGDHDGVGADDTTNVRSWYDAYTQAKKNKKSIDKADLKAIDYGITWKQAVDQMKIWGKVGVPVFNLDTENDNLENEVNKRINNLFKTDKTEFKKAFNKAGEDYKHWKIKDGFKKWIKTDAKDENNFLICKEKVFSVLADTFFKWHLDKADKTADINLKKQYHKNIDDYHNGYYDSTGAYNETSNKKRIADLEKEIKKTSKTTGTAKGWQAVGLCQRYLGNDPDEWKKVGLCQRYYG